MQSNQAISCLKALSQFERRISFERENESTGYVVKIEGLTYEPDRKIVRQIAKSLDLQVKEDTDSISVF
jgi:hypothetical protein